MTKLNMANMNTLFRKGYLLAGVIMVANMFVANEMKAMEEQNVDTQEQNANNDKDKNANTVLTTEDPIQNQETFQAGNISQQKEIDALMGGEKGDQKKQSSLDKLLSCENYFNLFGTLALSCANNYFKWWDYNAGGYLKLRIGCLGWRTKKFFDIVQLDFNLNLGRGALWLILHIISRRSLTKAKIKEENKENIEKIDEENGDKSVSNVSPWVSFLFKDILRGFVSAPLTFHISKFNFSISISLDSILWEFVIGSFLKETGQQPNKENQFDNNSIELERLQDTSNDKKEDNEEKKEETDKNPGTTTN